MWQCSPKRTEQITNITFIASAFYWLHPTAFTHTHMPRQKKTHTGLPTQRPHCWNINQDYYNVFTALQLWGYNGIMGGGGGGRGGWGGRRGWRQEDYVSAPRCQWWARTRHRGTHTSSYSRLGNVTWPVQTPHRIPPPWERSFLYLLIKIAWWIVP